MNTSRWSPGRGGYRPERPAVCARALTCAHTHAAKEAARTLELAQVECRDTLYLTLNTRALKPTITLFGSRLSATRHPPRREARYTTSLRNAVKRRASGI